MQRISKISINIESIKYKITPSMIEKIFSFIISVVISLFKRKETTKPNISFYSEDQISEISSIISNALNLDIQYISSAKNSVSYDKLNFNFKNDVNNNYNLSMIITDNEHQTFVFERFYIKKGNYSFMEDVLSCLISFNSSIERQKKIDQILCH